MPKKAATHPCPMPDSTAREMKEIGDFLQNHAKGPQPVAYTET